MYIFFHCGMFVISMSILKPNVNALKLQEHSESANALHCHRATLLWVSIKCPICYRSVLHHNGLWKLLEVGSLLIAACHNGQSHQTWWYLGVRSQWSQQDKQVLSIVVCPVDQSHLPLDDSHRWLVLHCILLPMLLLLLSFLSRISILTHNIDIANLSVRPSICSSVRLLRSGIVWKRLNVLSYYYQYCCCYFHFCRASAYWGAILI